MNWLQKLSVNYLDIGHRHYREDIDKIPDFVVWVFRNGDIQASSVNPYDKTEEADASHGSLFGKTDDTYSGCYEPETGRISIIRPSTRKFSIPSALIQLLKEKFGFIWKIYEF